MKTNEGIVYELRKLFERESIRWGAAFVVAFMIVAAILNPFLSNLTGSDTPVVTVMSDSMEHHVPLDEWWQRNSALYQVKNITEEDFKTFPYTSGLNVGDMVVVVAKRPEDIQVGEVLVFQNKKNEIIMHRVIDKWTEREGGVDRYYFWTKGDNHYISIDARLFNERRIPEEQVRGVAAYRISYLGLPRALLRI
jgi:signal peptidase I